MAEPRKFTHTVGVRERTPLLVGLVGPSGSGKTYSALRIATGIQRVAGGDVGVIDTEARRALHYADKFKFQHLDFRAPFGPLDYLAAIDHLVNAGMKTIVVDSASHEHEGPGGVLEMHTVEAERLAALWKTSIAKAQLPAWNKPKSERRRLLNSILQKGVNFIFGFRAKEKIDIDKLSSNDRDERKQGHLGWMPIAGEEFVYEMTLNCLLYPNSGGIPTWHTEAMGERAIIKLPGQFREMFKEPKPLDENMGQALAEWAAGTAKPAAAPVPTAPSEHPQAATTPNRIAQLQELARLREVKGWPAEQAAEWRAGIFGEADARKMTEQQLTDAITLLGMAASDYDAEMASLRDLGRVK